MFEENPKILIIDDIASNIQVVANVLKKHNFNISYAQNGKTGIERAKQISFDLILLDIMMPEMDGYEVCARLKKDPKTKDVPVIFLTAKTTEDSLKKGFESGGVDFISKPFKTAELIARVNTHIQLKSVREILSTTNIRLQEANSSKDKLLSIIAHDLRNPFSVLITFSKLLLDSYDDFSKDDVINYLKTFYQTSKQGYNLLDNLLKWSKSQTGNLDVEGEVIDFKDIVEENITLLNSQAKNKDIQLINNVAEDVFAFADLNMILTVVRNLLTNAIKFTNNGGKVEVTGVNYEKYVEISIKDNGIGISEEDLEKIFRIDIKHSTEGTANERGSGLGLVLCKEFIEKNLGTLKANSALGEGSEFVFILPRAEE
jgi:two-component system, sensor histidine kinase and response regulator